VFFKDLRGVERHVGTGDWTLVRMIGRRQERVYLVHISARHAQGCVMTTDGVGIRCIK